MFSLLELQFLFTPLMFSLLEMKLLFTPLMFARVTVLSNSFTFTRHFLLKDSTRYALFLSDKIVLFFKIKYLNYVHVFSLIHLLLAMSV